MELEEKKKRLDRLRRQLSNLMKNFEAMVSSDEETNLMLDWINEIRKEIKQIEKELK